MPVSMQSLFRIIFMNNGVHKFSKFPANQPKYNIINPSGKDLSNIHHSLSFIILSFIFKFFLSFFLPFFLSFSLPFFLSFFLYLFSHVRLSFLHQIYFHHLKTFYHNFWISSQEEEIIPNMIRDSMYEHYRMYVTFTWNRANEVRISINLEIASL